MWGSCSWAAAATPGQGHVFNEERKIGRKISKEQIKKKEEKKRGKCKMKHKRKVRESKATSGVRPASVLFSMLPCLKLP